MTERHLANRKQAPTEVGVLTVEFDGCVEAADPLQRLTSRGEIAAVEDGAEPQDILDEQLRQHARA